jgi:hypothetical protein
MNIRAPFYSKQWHFSTTCFEVIIYPPHYRVVMKSVTDISEVKELKKTSLEFLVLMKTKTAESLLFFKYAISLSDKLKLNEP